MDQNLRKYMLQDGDAGFTAVDDSKRRTAPFFCYSKNIPSLLMRLPQRQISKHKKLEKHYLDNAFSDPSPEQQSYNQSDQAAFKQYVK